MHNFVRPLASPVRFGEEDGGIRLSDEVFIGGFADGEEVFLPTGQRLEGQGGLHLRAQHAQVRRQHVDEDLRGQEKVNHIKVYSNLT